MTAEAPKTRTGLMVNDNHVPQRKRILLLWAYGVLFLLCVLFVDPVFYGSILGEIMFIAGISLVMISALGRCWATAHIGSRKNVELIQTGPYGYCRNPLYLFSSLATFGLGLVSQSIVLTIALTMAVVATFMHVIRLEERYLKNKFGKSYEVYKENVPTLIPRFGTGIARSHAQFVWAPRRHLRSFTESLAIPLLIPVVLLFEWTRSLFGLDLLTLM